MSSWLHSFSHTGPEPQELCPGNNYNMLVPAFPSHCVSSPKGLQSLGGNLSLCYQSHSNRPSYTLTTLALKMVVTEASP